MTAQPGPDQPIAGVFRWNVYSPEHKVDLTALVVESPTVAIFHHTVSL